MDYEPMLDVYKELFRKFSGERPMEIPSDEFLTMAARMEGHLRGKGQQVEENIGCKSLWLQATPADIGIEIDPEGKIRMWIDFKGRDHYWIRDVWTGRFERFFKEFFDYKEVEVIGEKNLGEFNPEQELDKFLLISSQFRDAYPQIKVTVDKFEEDLEKLYCEANLQLAVILK